MIKRGSKKVLGETHEDEPVVAHEAALLARICLEGIGRDHESLEHELGSAVSDKTSEGYKDSRSV